MKKIKNILLLFKNLILRRKKIVILLTVIAVIVLVIIGINRNNNKPLESTKPQKGDLKQELTLSGEISATEKASLAFPVSGKIVYIGATEGEFVNKNQLLASLDQSTTLKNYQSALIDYSKQRNTFEQTKDDQGVDRPEDATNDEVKRVLQNNQYDLDKAVVSLELKDIAKRDSYLYTPIDGIITNLGDYHVGSNEVAATPIFEIVNPDTLYFSVSADQTEVVDLFEGQSCDIMLDSFPDQKFRGIISSISFTPSEEDSGTVYKIKVSFSGSDFTKLRLGMTGDATFVIKEVGETLYLPSKFVKTDDKGSYVVTTLKGEKKYIKTGIETDDNVEILEGIDKDQLVYD